MREIWETKFSPDKKKPEFVTTNMLNLGEEIGKSPDAQKMKSLIIQKRIDLEKKEVNMQKK